MVMLVVSVSGDDMPYHQRSPDHERLLSVYTCINLVSSLKWQEISYRLNPDNEGNSIDRVLSQLPLAGVSEKAFELKRPISVFAEDKCEKGSQ